MATLKEKGAVNQTSSEVPLNPILLNIPQSLSTPRLFLRTPRQGDATIAYPIVRESLNELKTWMPWATDKYSPEDAEDWYRKAAAKFINREELAYLIFLKDESQYLGNVSAFAFDWNVPKCEIGYWLRTTYTDQGYMTEAAAALIAMVKEALQTRRIEIQMNAKNQKSRAVAERLGFQLEGILRSNAMFGENLIDSCVYAWVQTGRSPSP
jgi:ribosomal-protein-serine acetyltransferase